MKYGKTERISGLVILLALLAIFVPWLMSDPAPREERPQPTFVIEQPDSVPRQEVPTPRAPSSIDALPSNESGQSAANQEGVDSIDAAPQAPQTGQATQTPSTSGQQDPIAELVASSEAGVASSEAGSATTSPPEASASSNAPATSAQGEWAVQVGSFGEVANAERLSDQLSSQGFSAFRRARDNNLTSVYVGPYATSEQGESAMALIKQRANVQGLLVRVRD